MSSRYALLKSLTARDLKEIAKRYNISGISGLKKAGLAKLLSQKLDISDEELAALVKRMQTDKLLGKIHDARDHFLAGGVGIEHVSPELIRANVGGYTVAIQNLGSPDFSYRCDDRCRDWLYQVRSGRYPFCKHYPAVLAELIFRGLLDPEETTLNHISPPLLSALLELVETRRIEEGLIATRGRNIEQALANIREHLIPISRQNVDIARNVYHDTPDRVFERLVEQAFQLLEFDTIPRGRLHGWDLLLLGTLSTPPYIVVVETKTAASGIYDHVVRSPDYLIRLKSYCIDMVQAKLMGVYKDYVRYCLLVGPGFPTDVDPLCFQFRHMTEGIKLALLPANVLLHLVERYRTEPILTHSTLTRLFAREGVITEQDVDQLFLEAKASLQALAQKTSEAIKERVEHVASRTADACFIKFDAPGLGLVMKDIANALAPELMVIGKKEITGAETIYIKHDYYAIWEKVLQEIAKAFAEVLKQESLLQEKRTELKQEVCRFLEL